MSEPTGTPTAPEPEKEETPFDPLTGPWGGRHTGPPPPAQFSHGIASPETAQPDPLAEPLAPEFQPLAPEAVTPQGSGIPAVSPINETRE